MGTNIDKEKRISQLASTNYFQWSGVSGTSYLHLIYKLVRIPPFTNVNFALVRREKMNRCVPIYFGVTAEDECRFLSAETFMIARALGANELHIHVANGTLLDQMNVQYDLVCNYNAPLNRMKISSAFLPHAA